MHILYAHKIYARIRSLVILLNGYIWLIVAVRVHVLFTRCMSSWLSLRTPLILILTSSIWTLCFFNFEILYSTYCLTRNTIELYPTILKFFNRNEYRLVVNLAISNISGHWLKIKKLLKKYGKTAVNLHWSSARGTIETTHSIAKYHWVRCLDCASQWSPLQIHYRISLITFYF